MDKGPEWNEDKIQALVDTGFNHIAEALGYKERNLTLVTPEGISLSFTMGLLLQKGGTRDEVTQQQHDELLEKAKALIVDTSRPVGLGWGP